MAVARYLADKIEYFRTTGEIAQRAVQVQGMLAHRAQHRSVSIPDLLVAATAERHSLIVLHYDADYDRISSLTGQPAEWVVPRGSADHTILRLTQPDRRRRAARTTSGFVVVQNGGSEARRKLP